LSKEDTNRRFWILLAILGSIAIVVEYAETMLFPAIPDLIKEFEMNYNSSSWILSGYLITAAVMAPIAGKLSDVYGKKGTCNYYVYISSEYSFGRF
jgi:MFS family permease